MKILLLIFLIFIFSLSICNSYVAASDVRFVSNNQVAVGCCYLSHNCYEISQERCQGSWHPGLCLTSDECYAVYECYPGDVLECSENGHTGIKNCNQNNIYGPCIITDASYLDLIDKDHDGDPDSTDCQPDNINIYWGNGCGEMFAPPSFVNIGAWLFKIVLAILIIFFLWKLWELNKREYKKKKTTKK